MPEYLAPGVYVEEISIGTKPIEGVSTSNAGFLGLSERGPSDVRLVTSFGQFEALYGGPRADSYLAYAVDGFFRNGGARAFIGRITRSDAVAASNAALLGVAATAAGKGAYGDRIHLLVQPSSLDPAARFKLIVAYWNDAASIDLVPADGLKSAAILEIYDNLSHIPGDAEYVVTKINKLSQLIRLAETAPAARPADTAAFIPLAGGSDGVAALSPLDFEGNGAVPPKDRVGLEALKQIDEINIVAIPDIALFDANQAQWDALTQSLVNHCENLKDRFAVLSSKANEAGIAALTTPIASTYAGFYYPWIKVFDPLTKDKKAIPPVGHVAGIYARSDIERGVHKAPANEVVRGAIEMEFKIAKGEQDVLNPRGVNVIREFPGGRRLVWGARTCSSDPEWKYINVRRLFLFLEESIEEGTQWVVFEPNNEQLWARVKQTVVQFLTTVWRTGALQGATAEEAFFVECGKGTTMTQADIDNGKLIVMIGVAPTKPAEFVIFRIFQWTADAA